MLYLANLSGSKTFIKVFKIGNFMLCVHYVLYFYEKYKYLIQQKHHAYNKFKNQVRQ